MALISELVRNMIYMDVQVKNMQLMGFILASPSSVTNQDDRQRREGQEMEMMVAWLATKN